MSTAIEWSLSLPCPDQRDAIVASVVDGGQASSGAATADHLRSCLACHAFRDSLRTQRLLLRHVAQEQQEEAEKLARQRQLRADIGEWVEQELKVRGEKDLARKLWRCGGAILRIDPDVSRHCFSESSDGQVDTSSVGQLLSAALEKLDSGGLCSRNGKVMERRVRASLADMYNKFLRGDYLGLQSRVDAVHIVSDFADRVSDKLRGPTCSLRANVEWYYGTASLVPRFLNQALGVTSDSLQRAHAIANLALWKSSNGSFEAAIELGREAALMRKSFVTLRVNLAVWTTMIGDRRNADRYIAEAATSIGSTTFRRLWPWTLVGEWLNRCHVIAATSARERAHAINSMWIAYHRWCGFSPGESSQPTSAHVETSS